MGFAGKPLVVLRVYHRRFAFNDFRAFCSVLNVPACPRLLPQLWGAFYKILNSRCFSRTGENPRRFLTFSLPSRLVFSVRHLGCLTPDSMPGVNLANVLLIVPNQCAEKLRLGSITFIKCEPLKLDSMCDGSIVKFKSDIGLWAIHNRIRDL